jgi:hypothetical protein
VGVVEELEGLSPAGSCVGCRSGEEVAACDCQDSERWEEGCEDRNPGGKREEEGCCTRPGKSRWLKVLVSDMVGVESRTYAPKTREIAEVCRQ